MSRPQVKHLSAMFNEKARAQASRAQQEEKRVISSRLRQSELERKRMGRIQHLQELRTKLNNLISSRMFFPQNIETEIATMGNQLKILENRYLLNVEHTDYPFQTQLVSPRRPHPGLPSHWRTVERPYTPGAKFGKRELNTYRWGPTTNSTGKQTWETSREARAQYLV
jgi:hypothetical protein